MKMNTILSVCLAAVIVGVAVGPARAANVALGKPATGTTYNGWFPTAAATDGIITDKTHVTFPSKQLDNYWLAPQNATGAGATFTLDLLGVYDISQINLVNTRNFQHNGSGDSGTNAFQLSTSEDGAVFTPLLNSNLPASNSGKLFGGLSRSARFLTFQANSYYGVRAGLAEIQVEGTLDVSKPHDLAAGKTTSGISYDGRFPTSAVNDGMIQDLRPLSTSPLVNSYWLAKNGLSGPGQYFEVDLGGLHQVSEFVAINTVNHYHSGAANGDSGTADFQILVSTDGTTFTPVVDATLTNRIGPNPNNSVPEYFELATPAAATHVRFQVDSFYGSRGGLSEFAVISDAPVGSETMVGNELTPRQSGADGATDILYSNFMPMPGAGTVDSVSINFQGATSTFSMFQLRHVSGSDPSTAVYDVVYDSGVITPSGTSGTVISLAFPNGPTSVQPGDIFAHWDRGIPYSDAGGLNATNLHAIYYPSLGKPGQGTQITLGSATYPKNTNYVRDYAWAVEFAPATVAVIPEPATMCALGLAVAGLGGYVRRRRKRA